MLDGGQTRRYRVSAPTGSGVEAKGIMLNLTPVASSKVKEIMNMQSPAPVALRVAVVGGGCSGFQSHMAFENALGTSL